MDIQVATLCDSAQDYNGKLCLIGTFDTLAVRQLPASHPHCSIALRMAFTTGDEGPHTLKISLIDEDGKNLLPDFAPKLQVRIPEGYFFTSQNLVLNLQGLKFANTGQYSIDIAFDDVIKARIPFQVLLAEEKGKPGPGN